jgi:hypothetical protein
MFMYNKDKELAEPKTAETPEPTPPTENNELPVKDVDTIIIEKPAPARTNDSFLKNITVKRQEYQAPPTQNEPTPETTTEPETEESSEEENKRKLSKEGVGIGAEFIVETEDLLIPKFMAFFDPDDDADPEDFELDDRKKTYLTKSWDKYLAFKTVNMTPGQELIYAHIVGFGAPMLLSGAHKLLKYLKEKKEEKKTAAAVSESIKLQRELNELKGLNPDGTQKTQPTTTPTTTTTPQPQQAPPPQVENDKPEEGDNRENIGVATEPKQTPFKPNGEITENTKICANDRCKKQFIEGQGFAKKETSKFYDMSCSKACSNRVVGLTGGAPKK